MAKPRCGGVDRRSILVGSAASMVAGPGARAQTPARVTPVRLTINTFPNATNLALFIGEANGVFSRRGLEVVVELTQNSQDQRRRLGDGEVDLAYSAIDNAIAMVETTGKDIVIVSGGDTSMMELMVRPEIVSLADMKGRTLVVDRAGTAYAFQARKALKDEGLLPDRDYRMKEVGATAARVEAMLSGADGVAAGMLNPPFSFDARDRGLKSLGRAVDLIGPYQGGGFFTSRAWATAHAPLLVEFLAAYIEATRMALDPANRAEAIGLLATGLRQAPALAERTYDEALLVPRFGLVPDARLDLDGLRSVLALRAEIAGQWDGIAPPVDRYVALGYYDQALAEGGTGAGGGNSGR